MFFREPRRVLRLKKWPMLLSVATSLPPFSRRRILSRLRVKALSNADRSGVSHSRAMKPSAKPMSPARRTRRMNLKSWMISRAIGPGSSPAICTSRPDGNTKVSEPAFQFWAASRATVRNAKGARRISGKVQMGPVRPRSGSEWAILLISSLQGWSGLAYTPEPTRWMPGRYLRHRREKDSNDRLEVAPLEPVHRGRPAAGRHRRTERSGRLGPRHQDLRTPAGRLRGPRSAVCVQGQLRQSQPLLDQELSR